MNEPSEFQRSPGLELESAEATSVKHVTLSFSPSRNFRDVMRETGLRNEWTCGMVAQAGQTCRSGPFGRQRTATRPY